MGLKGAHAALPQNPDPREHPLSARAIHCLRNAGIRTVGQLAERSADELLALPQFGADSLRRTEAYLAGLGLSLSEDLYHQPWRTSCRDRINPRVEEKLRSAGLWDGSSSGGPAPGTRLRDLLCASGLSAADELDGLLSALAERRVLPRPRGMNEFLGLLAASEGARRATEAARWRLSPGPRSAAAAQDAALDATGSLLDAAEAVGLTDNGVSAHLATLERDGIVRQRGTVSRGAGGGKPAYVYELTPEAEDLFPKAYGPVLRRLLDVMVERLGPEETEALLRAVGRRMADKRNVPVDDVRARLEAAVAVLNELGGLAELEERSGSFVIRGYDCPLTAVTPDHPEVCRLAEALLAELVGVPVHEHCDRSENPRCCFEVVAVGDTTRR